MYCGLHNHTQYSNITTGLDSINKLNDLVDEAKKLGMGGIAITNHDNLSEVIEINRKQKQLQKEEDSFKIAIGNEIYLVDSYDPSDNQSEIYLEEFYYGYQQCNHHYQHERDGKRHRHDFEKFARRNIVI